MKLRGNSLEIETRDQDRSGGLWTAQHCSAPLTLVQHHSQPLSMAQLRSGTLISLRHQYVSLQLRLAITAHYHLFTYPLKCVCSTSS